MNTWYLPYYDGPYAFGIIKKPEGYEGAFESIEEAKKEIVAMMGGEIQEIQHSIHVAHCLTINDVENDR